MLKLHLNSHFPDGFSKELETHFLTRFGVYAKPEVQSDGSTLVLFKYDQIEANWKDPITSLCRGHIYRFKNGVWTRVLNAFDKFHNYGDTKCSIQDLTQDSLYIQSKEDGSLINVWWDESLNTWRASTSGTISPLPIQDFPTMKFDTLFWKVAGIDPKHFKGDKEYSYAFELTTGLNRVVSKYPTDRLYLLGSRHVETGEYVQDLQHIYSILKVNGFQNLFMTFKSSLASLGINSKESLLEWMNTKGEAYFKANGVEYPEGFVIYNGLVPAAKIKYMNYLTLHSAISGDMKHTRNVLIENFFNGKIDDIIPALSPHHLEFVELLKNRAMALSQAVREATSHFVGVTFETQKDYALLVQKVVPKTLTAFFFAEKTKILSGMNIDELFKKWLETNYLKFEDYWKE